MRHGPSRPSVPSSRLGRWPRPWRPGAGAALATAAVLALASPVLADSGGGPVTTPPYRPMSLPVSGPAALAASATGRYLGAGHGAVMFAQVGGHRYTVSAAAEPHARWQPAPGARAAVRPGQAQATLRLNVTDLAGKPASNVRVVLMNTDNAALDPVPVTVTRAGRVNVASGDYSLFAYFADPMAFHCVFLNDFRVGTAGATVTIPTRPGAGPRRAGLTGWRHDQPARGAAGHRFRSC